MQRLLPAASQPHPQAQNPVLSAQTPQQSHGEDAPPAAGGAPGTPRDGAAARSELAREQGKVPSIVQRTLLSSGEPPDATDLKLGERRFGHRFDDLRIHSDALACRSLDLLGARGYAWGNHVALRQDDPDRPRILEHELGHVAREGVPVGRGPQGIGSLKDPEERAADRVGDLAHLPATKPSTLLRRVKDSRLDGLLDSLARSADEIKTLDTPVKRVQAILTIFEGVDLSDGDNYRRLLRKVSPLTDSETFILLAQVLEDAAVQEYFRANQSRAEVQMQNSVALLGPPKHPIYGTHTPFPVSEIVIGNAAKMSEMLGVPRAAFFDGLIEGFENSGKKELAQRLAQKVAQSYLINPLVPVIYSAGAVTGIVQEVKGALVGLWEIITDFPGFLEKLAKLIEMCFDPASSRMLGFELGKEMRGDLEKLADANVFKFVFEVGRITGPLVVEALLCLVGVGEVAVASKAVQALVKLFKTNKKLLAAVRHLKAFIKPLAKADIDDIVKAVDKLEDATVPRVTGKKKPRIADTPVPTKKRRRLEAEDIPKRAGETLDDTIARVRKVEGALISEIPEFASALARAKKTVMKGKTLTKENYGDLYKNLQRQFWKEIRKDEGALKKLRDAGFHLPEKEGAAFLGGVKQDVPFRDTQLSLDHVDEKAIDQNWMKALDDSNLELAFTNPNSFREIVQMRFPHLRGKPPTPGADAPKVRVSTQHGDPKKVRVDDRDARAKREADAEHEELAEGEAKGKAKARATVGDSPTRAPARAPTKSQPASSGSSKPARSAPDPKAVGQVVKRREALLKDVKEWLKGLGENLDSYKRTLGAGESPNVTNEYHWDDLWARLQKKNASKAALRGKLEGLLKKHELTGVDILPI